MASLDSEFTDVRARLQGRIGMLWAIAFGAGGALLFSLISRVPFMWAGSFLLWLFAVLAIYVATLDMLMLKATWRVAGIHALIMFSMGGVMELIQQLFNNFTK